MARRRRRTPSVCAAIDYTLLTIDNEMNNIAYASERIPELIWIAERVRKAVRRLEEELEGCLGAYDRLLTLRNLLDDIAYELATNRIGYAAHDVERFVREAEEMEIALPRLTVLEGAHVVEVAAALGEIERVVWEVRTAYDVLTDYITAAILVGHTVLRDVADAVTGRAMLEP